MKNILIFAPIALENGRGGEISAIELAVGLNNFYNVTLIDTNRLTSQKILSEDVIIKKLKGVKRNLKVKYSILRIFDKTIDFPFPWDIVKLFKEVKKNDVIYFSVSNFKTDFIFLLFLLIIRSIKVIVGYRKPLYSEKTFSLYNIKYRLTILFFSLFNKRLYHHTISKYGKVYLENFFNPDKINHIIHGVELDKYIDEKVIENKKDKLKFIYVGYLDDVHKGVNILLSSIELLLINEKDLKISFEFCGSGPLESRLIELEKRFPNYIKFNGYVNYDKLPKYYKRNDIFISSSRREPFGRVYIEALASNLIILCTKTFGSIEILKGKKFGFFIQKLEPIKIKQKILEIYEYWMKNPLIIEELKQSAKDFALKNYSFSKELSMFNDLINKIAK